KAAGTRSNEAMKVLLDCMANPLTSLSLFRSWKKLEIRLKRQSTMRMPVADLRSALSSSNCANPLGWLVALCGQSLPAPLWQRGEPQKTTHDHSVRQRQGLQEVFWRA